MDTTDWVELCYDALGVPRELPEPERRQQAEHALLDGTGQPRDILGIGAAEAAIDLVVRYGAAGDLSEVLLRWEQADDLPPGLLSLGDEGMQRATTMARELLRSVVAFTEGRSTEILPPEEAQA